MRLTRNHRFPWLLLIACVLATIFYVYSAIIYSVEAEGFRVFLALKEQPGWASALHGKGVDYQERQQLVILLDGDWEQGTPWWVVLYKLGLFATGVAWIAFIALTAFRVLRAVKSPPTPVVD